MLSFRGRANRRSGGSSESHASLPTATTSSLFDRKPFHTSGYKNSLRGRLKDLKKNIARKGIPKQNKNNMPYMHGPWYDVKSNDDLLCLAPADAQHVELGGQTWPAIRRNLGSMAPSLWVNRDSVDSSRSPEEASRQASCRDLKPSFEASHRGGRRWATMVTRVHPIGIASRRSTSHARHSSFSTISEAASRQDCEPAPQLPMGSQGSSLPGVHKQCPSNDCAAAIAPQESK
ncbi:hypothetical protein ONZ43_g713 [Nemania bipapillata]|uniref:Uncharacterized protein n=1 Tax=Nemania bipapillata TaxID=110536 RepID=A0ACC2J7I6_9PEZI|nr:hypothetical protein ONZ43_g713 [Nemania bipapillata]